MGCAKDCEIVSEYEARIHAVLEGQNALALQTKRIREILIGLDDPFSQAGIDTLDIARQVMAKLDEKENEIDRLNELLLLNKNNPDSYDGCACGGGFIVSFKYPYFEKEKSILHGIQQCTLE